MNHCSRLLLLCFSLLVPQVSASPVTPYHLVWDSPSKDCHGSMPLGNGDISLNAWIEQSGDLCFYIGKTDAWGDNARLLKLGKIRVKIDPAPPVVPFKQELALSDGMMIVTYGDGTTLRVWVDANHPVIHVETASNQSTTATVILEPWRTKQETLASIESSDVMKDAPVGEAAPTVVEPDIILTGQSNRIGWYHRNIKSVGPAAHARIQGVTGFPREDPLLHRTFGAVVTATRPVQADDQTLRSESGKNHRFDIHVLTLHPATSEQWLTAINHQITSIGQTPHETRMAAHCQWWRNFWGRSWIQASSNTSPTAAPLNNLPIRLGSDQQGQNKFSGDVRGFSSSVEDLQGNFTLNVEINPRSGATGRIIDKMPPGGSDGFLLDLQPENQIRLIIGSEQHITKYALPTDRWSKVVVHASIGGWKVNINDKTVINTGTGGAAKDDADYLSQMFALQRFVTACAGRGSYPIKFNGSIFTVSHPGKPGDADYRRWGPGYWWQNTRMPYLSACANGDTEILESLFQMYADRVLPLNIYRTKRYFGFDNAAYFPECIHFWGDVFNVSYGWTPMEKRKDPLQESGWHKWEWVAGPELVWMMIEAYEHTGDPVMLEKRIIPTADAVIRFFDNYYKTDASGQLVMYPSMACETWWDCTNPMPELAGLHAITAKLLALPDGAIPADKRSYWKTFAAKLAPLPVRDTPDGKALAPAARFANKKNVENPELYAVFPFRLCSFEKNNRELGLNALKHRWNRGHRGWRQDDIFMAYLGLADEAKKGLISRARNSDKSSRFPAFWGPNFDWTPDQCHGGVLMKTTQAMLMQTDGKRIFLLPAWPKEWNVKFKLHAPQRTTVECEVKDGKIISLSVTPESRRADLTISKPFEE